VDAALKRGTRQDGHYTVSECYGYIFYFLFSLFTSRKTQHDTYQNSYSEFILNFLDIIYSQITQFRKRLYLLQLEPLVFPDYALFSNHDCGYGKLVKVLVAVCQSAWESLIICFLIVSHLYIIINRQTSRYIVGYLPVKSTKKLLENWRKAKPNTPTNSMFTEFQTYFL
jgi:hypothetical protein